MDIFKRFSIATLLTGLVFAFAACGDDNPSSPGDGGDDGNGTTSMSATVDGQAWVAVATSAVRTGGVIAVGGSDLGLTGIGFGLLEAGTGTFDIGPGSATNGSVTSGQQVWTASGTNGSGSVTITNLTTTRVAGTFSFTAPGTAPGQTPPTRVVTNGAFDVEFN